ncbi:hypothetical protein HZB78_05485 [Candidatus Collierbacteria bacterium]|nr:hypothetical protein [Candidatus Collierbacteria bacterium]
MKAIAEIIILTILIVAFLGGIAFGVPSYSRYQKRADANNEVLINEVRIRQQEQLVKVETQKADIRVVEAGGIAKSQAIINSSLTPTYLQYLAIQAQEKMAGSPNHTQIYIPVGTNGIPLVKTIE